MSEPIKPRPDIYRKAARIIEENGWITGSYASKSVVDPEKQCYCMEGAIMKAMGVKPCSKNIQGRSFHVLIHADEYIFRKTKHRYPSASDWNDSRRSAKPVIKMLNDIADALEKEQGE